MSCKKSYKSFLMLIFGAGLLAAQGGGTMATVTRDSVFPPVGLATTETVQINVLNTATSPSNGTAASCTGTITFANSSGATIGTATSFTVTSGQVASAKLPYSSAGATGRAEIVGSVQTTISFPQKAPCSLVFSLETFDTSSGVTHIFLGNASANSAPQFSLGH
jgi:hypothetical protein